MSKEETLKNIPGLKESDEVIIQKLGYGSLIKLRNKCTDAGMNNDGTVLAKMLFGEYNKWLLIYGVKKAPFFDKCRTANYKSLVIDQDSIEPETGDYIFKKIQEINKFEQVEQLKKE